MKKITNKEKYYWKVVRKDQTLPGLYKSCVIDYGRYSLKYKIGRPTKSAMKENGILVFNTKKNARDFNRKQNGKIFKCKVKGREIKFPVFYSIYELELGNRVPSHVIFPFGTRSFPSVTLVK